MRVFLRSGAPPTSIFGSGEPFRIQNSNIPQARRSGEGQGRADLNEADRGDAGLRRARRGEAGCGEGRVGSEAARLKQFGKHYRVDLDPWTDIRARRFFCKSGPQRRWRQRVEALEPL